METVDEGKLLKVAKELNEVLDLSPRLIFSEKKGVDLFKKNILNASSLLTENDKISDETVKLLQLLREGKKMKKETEQDVKDIKKKKNPAFKNEGKGKYIESLIAKKKYTIDNIKKMYAEKFPQANVSSVNVWIKFGSSEKTLKRTKFPKLIKTSKNGILYF